MSSQRISGMDKLPNELLAFKVLSEEEFSYEELERLRGVSRSLKSHVEARIQQAVEQLSVQLESLAKEVDGCGKMKQECWLSSHHPRFAEFTSQMGYKTPKQVLMEDLDDLRESLAIFRYYKSQQATRGFNFYGGKFLDTFKKALAFVEEQLTFFQPILQFASGVARDKKKLQELHELTDDWYLNYVSANNEVYELLERDMAKIGYVTHIRTRRGAFKRKQLPSEIPLVLVVMREMMDLKDGDYALLRTRGKAQKKKKGGEESTKEGSKKASPTSPRIQVTYEEFYESRYFPKRAKYHLVRPEMRKAKRLYGG